MMGDKIELELFRNNPLVQLLPQYGTYNINLLHPSDQSVRVTATATLSQSSLTFSLKCDQFVANGTAFVVWKVGGNEVEFRISSRAGTVVPINFELASNPKVFFSLLDDHIFSRAEHVMKMLRTRPDELELSGTVVLSCRGEAAGADRTLFYLDMHAFDNHTDTLLNRYKRNWRGLREGHPQHFNLSVDLMTRTIEFLIIGKYNQRSLWPIFQGLRMFTTSFRMQKTWDCYVSFLFDESSKLQLNDWQLMMGGAQDCVTAGENDLYWAVYERAYELVGGDEARRADVRTMCDWMWKDRPDAAREGFEKVMMANARNKRR